MTVPFEIRSPIMGNSMMRPETMVSFVQRNNKTAPDIAEIANAFLEIGKVYNIRGDMAFCQSIIETGWFAYQGSAVTPDQHNYAGIGVTQRGVKGNSFPTVQDGVRAQIQHLYAYASKLPLPDGETLIDPRFRYVTRGIAPCWEDLNGKWAMSDTYGQQIVAMYKNLVTHSIACLTAGVRETVFQYDSSEPVLCEVCQSERDAVVEKPYRIKRKGKMIVGVYRTPIWICLDCFYNELTSL